MTELNEAKLVQILPENLANDTNVSASAKAIDSQLQLVSRNTNLPLIYFNLDDLSSEQLDHLAYSWDAPIWRQTWPMEMKRTVLKNVIQDKRKRGTLGAVKAAVESLSYVTEITEWWQTTPKGTPHTFTATVQLEQYSGVLESELQEDVIALINDAKPVRSHFTFVLHVAYGGKINACSVARNLTYARVKQKSVNGDFGSENLNLIPGIRPLAMGHVMSRTITPTTYNLILGDYDLTMGNENLVISIDG